MRRYVYPVLVPALLALAMGLTCLAWFPPSGTTSPSGTPSPTSETTSLREREVTRIVPWPLTVEVIEIATSTVPPFQLTETVTALSPQPTRKATRTPRPTVTPTATATTTFDTDQQGIRARDGDG